MSNSSPSAPTAHAVSLSEMVEAVENMAKWARSRADNYGGVWQKDADGCEAAAVTLRDVEEERKIMVELAHCLREAMGYNTHLLPPTLKRESRDVLSRLAERTAPGGR